MNNNPEISIIIPVYNADKHLEKCLSFLDSTSQDDLQKIEVICVNDGSSDSSFSILQRYKNKYSIIKIINQQNKGVSNARNQGLDVAKGEYVFFVDADDYLVEDAIKILLRTIQSRSDIYEFSTIRLSKEIKEERILSPSKSLVDFLALTCNPLWCYLFSKKIIENNDLCFLETVKYAEDLHFSIKFISLITSAEVYKDIIYIYNIDNDSSAMNKVKDYNAVQSHFIVIKDLIDFSYTNRIKNYNFLFNSIIRMIKIKMSFIASMKFKSNTKVEKQFRKHYKKFHKDYLICFFKKNRLSLVKRVLFNPLCVTFLIFYYKFRL